MAANYISAKYNFTIMLKTDGSIWTWGNNAYGQLGDNSATSRYVPTSVSGANKTFCKISAGIFHSMAIDKNGKIWGWGRNNYGQLGSNSYDTISTPIMVAGSTKTFCQISAGLSHTVAIDKNGKVWAWGYDPKGQLGINSTTNKSTPIGLTLDIGKTFCKISGGLTNSIAVDKNGKIYTWGVNTNGQLGDNTIVSKKTPVSILGFNKTFCEISGQYFVSSGIDKYGKIWNWGYNSYGTLGNNASAAHKSTPVSVGGVAKTFCKISIGLYYILSIDKNGRLWSWGYNNSGQLGVNSTTNYSTPISVLGAVKTFCQISAGADGAYAHSAAIDKDGKVWSWGYNNQGQMGTNSTTSTSTPVSVGGTTKTFCQISAGYYVSVAIDKNGKAWGWGFNQYGELGNNSVTPTSTPISVAGAIKTFCQISISYHHVISLDKNGKLWSWGVNDSGQLGDNTTKNRSTPVAICVSNTFCKISAGISHSLAIDNHGKYWSWGNNNNGQLGYIDWVMTPILISV